MNLEEKMEPKSTSQHHQQNQAATELPSASVAMNVDLMLSALLLQPNLAYLPETQLATRFEVPEELAAEAIRLSANKRHRKIVRRFSFRQFIQILKEKMVPIRNRMEKHAVLSLLLTFLIAAIGIGFTMLQNQIPNWHGFGTALQFIFVVVGTVLIVGAILAQMLILLFVAQVRYAWFLAGIWTAILFAVSLPSVIIDSGQAVLKSGMNFPELIVMVCFGFLIVGVFDGIFNSTICIAGAYLKVSKEEKQEQARSRREKIARLMQIQAQIEGCEYPPSKKTGPLYQSYRRFWPYSTLAVAAVLEILMILASLYRPFHGHVETIAVSSVKGGPFTGVITLLTDAILVLLGYWSRTSREAFLNLVSVMGMRLAFLIIDNQRYDTGRPLMFLVALLLGVFATAVFIYGGYYGAEVQRKSIYQKGRQQGDVQALYAEMTRLKLQLGQVYKTVTVMAVDASQSTEMKHGQEPMAVEYSFRSYQDWIASVCHKFGGQIHSTAGDGAIVSFSDAVKAYLAAKCLQSTINQFNQEENRLKKPFRIRIGIHTGQILGEIDSVVFTSVIDIAAHLEEVAPVGGIAITDPTRQLLAAEFPDERFAELSDLVDREAVYVALNPLDTIPIEWSNPDESEVSNTHVSTAPVSKPREAVPEKA